MSFFEAILLGIVEGVTEFLPISSTFHLLFVSKLLNIPTTEFVKAFSVIIQSGAIVAVLTLFGKTLVFDRSLHRSLLLSFIPTGIIAFLLNNIIRNTFFESEALMVSVFIGLGVLFIWYERVRKDGGSKQISDLSTVHAILVGIAQAGAVIPGVSRAGAVMLCMMLLGYHRAESAKYSFMLAVPTILAAGVFDLVETRSVLSNYPDAFGLLTVGLLSGFITALIVLKWFIQFLQSHTLVSFGIYRIVAGLLLLLLL